MLPLPIYDATLQALTKTSGEVIFHPPVKVNESLIPRLELCAKVTLKGL
jgi:hypothetical protein